MLQEIIKKLNDVKGLKVLAVLDKDMKHTVARLEEKRNTGIFSCLGKEFTLLVVHDSSFREPAGKIVEEENLEFPAVAFPEVDAKDVVSASPSLTVHFFLAEKLNLTFKEEEATLLIGFNL